MLIDSGECWPIHESILAKQHSHSGCKRHYVHHCATVHFGILQSGFATESSYQNHTNLYNTLMVFYFISDLEPYIYMPTWFHDCYGQGWNSITLYHRETLKSLIVSCCIAQKNNLSLQNQSVQPKPWITSKRVWRRIFFLSAWWNTWHSLPGGIIYNKGSRRKSETLATTKGKRGGVCVEKQTLKWPFNQQVNTDHDTNDVPKPCPDDWVEGLQFHDQEIIQHMLRVLNWDNFSVSKE